MAREAVEIDGAMGEGGGQVLRSSLALSLVTGRPVAITRIRAGRARPGLLHQHLAAVRAAAAIGQADLEGAELGSRSLWFRPRGWRCGAHRFDVGTAGSATLVLQTVLPALLVAPEPARLRLEGGTHNPAAPTFDFVDEVYLPALRRMGARVRASLQRAGFHPAGGGSFDVEVDPAPLVRIELGERGRVRRRRAVAFLSALPRHIAERELAVVRERLAWSERELSIVEVARPLGPGNAISLVIECDGITELFTGFGERRVPAERVASSAVTELEAYLGLDAAVGPYLADQLLVPLALGAGGSFLTSKPTLHTETNARVIEAFLGPRVELAERGAGVWTVDVRGREAAPA